LVQFRTQISFFLRHFPLLSAIQHTKIFNGQVCLWESSEILQQSIILVYVHSITNYVESYVLLQMLHPTHSHDNEGANTRHEAQHEISAPSVQT
jgi:hypothetical protein